MPQKDFVPSWKAWKKSSHALKGSNMYPDYFEMIVHNYNKISTLIPNTEVVAQSCSVKKVFQKVFVKKFAKFTGKHLS